jgi:class 3 adenylate cyclase
MIALYDHIQELRAELRGCMTRRERAAARAERRGTGETIRAALLCADLGDFTALSEATQPAAMIAALDAWFDRVAGAVHAFGGEVLKFIGDGVLAIFPVTGGEPSAASGPAGGASPGAEAATPREVRMGGIRTGLNANATSLWTPRRLRALSRQ